MVTFSRKLITKAPISLRGCADAQADLRLCCLHAAIAGFLARWPKVRWMIAYFCPDNLTNWRSFAIDKIEIKMCTLYMYFTSELFSFSYPLWIGDNRERNELHNHSIAKTCCRMQIKDINSPKF